MPTRKKIASPNPPDILFSRSQVPPFALSPDFASQLYRDSAVAGRKAAQFDADEGGIRNAISGQQEVTDRCQSQVDASGETARVRRGVGMEQVRRITADFRQADADIAASPKHNIINEPCDGAVDDVREACAEFRANASPLAEREARARAARNSFQRENPVRPPARYSRTPWTQFAWIFTAVVFESLVNAFFFINAADGLISAFLSIAFVAPLNCATASIIGLVTVRYARHRSRVARWFGIIGTALLGCFILVFNIYLAAVRLSLRGEGHLDVPGALAAIFSSHVLAVMDYQAWAVLISGLFWAGIAGWESFLILDPYPGYTSIYRSWENAEAALRAAREHHVARLSEIGRKRTAELEQCLNAYTRSVADLGRYLEAMESDAVRHDRQFATIRDIHQAAIQEFQTNYLTDPTGKESDLPQVTPVSQRQALTPPPDAKPIIAEADEILTRLVRMSHDSARQISVHVVTNMEIAPEMMREISQGALRATGRSAGVSAGAVGGITIISPGE